jgi:hypothetical protein
MAELLDSKIERHYGRVYDVPRVLAGRSFDLVFFGSLLMHLRDPIGALMAARSVCRGRLLATNWLIPPGDALAESPTPTADLPALGPGPAHQHSWWRPNRAAYRLWFEAAGFTRVDVDGTVTLTADREEAQHFNSTQLLQLADARV